MENKITRKSVLTKALDSIEWSVDEREVIIKMIASLDKKSSSSKPTKTQIENEKIRADVINLLADGTPRTATEIGVELVISCQKATAMLKPLVDNGTVVKIVGKGKEPTRFVVGE